jgi:hypothetical protein
MEENGSKPTNRNWLTEGLLLFLATALAYGLAFVYQAGHFSHFGLPWTLIEINIPSVVIALAALAFVFGLFLLFADVLHPFWLMIPPAIRFKLSWHLPFAMLPAVFYFVFESPALVIYLLLFPVTAFLFFDFVLPAIPRKNGLSYVARISASVTREINVTTFTDRFARRVGFNWFALVVGAVGLLYVTYIIGRTNGRLMDEFLQVQGRPNAVVLRVSNDQVISVLFDQKNKRLSGIFTVERIDSGSQFVFQKTYIGRLATPQTRLPRRANDK